MPNISPEVTSEQTSSYRFTPLNEHVSNDDLLKSAPHRAVSDSLHQLITENEKAISIGLEGRWGSGKSTVIDLLRKKLTENDSTDNVFFVFDTWAHEGDALRKSFLEEFAAQAAKNAKGRAKTQIEDTTNEALGKTRTRKVHSTKNISSYGVGMGLSLLLLPVGSSLLSKVDMNEMVWPWHKLAGSADWLFISALLLSFSPMFFSLLYWLWQTVANDKVNANWQWFNPNSQETITQNISDDKDRTSFEFQRYFKNILKQLNAGSGNKKKVVIVIDNLDRVEPDYAKAVWKTLQTFFQHRSSNDAEQNSMMDRVWFIVPYDREGLAAIWENDVLPVSLVSVRTGEETMFPASQTALTSEVPKAKPDVVKSFVEKSFQLVAEVPMPVTSDRHELITQYAEAAFSAWPILKRKELIERIRQWFDAGQYQSSASQPTPRQLKSLLNKIGFLAMQWGDRFSVGAYLYFAAVKSGETQQQFLDDVVSAAFPTARDSQPVLTSHFVEEVASLLFGVEKEIGMQMLMKEMIPTALKRGDENLLNRVYRLHSKQFVDIWKRLDQQHGMTETDLEESLLSEGSNNGLIRFNRDAPGAEVNALRAITIGLKGAFEMHFALRFTIRKYINALPERFLRFENQHQISALEILSDLKLFKSELNEACCKGAQQLIPVYIREKSVENSRKKTRCFKKLLATVSKLFDSSEKYRAMLPDKQWLSWVELCAKDDSEQTPWFAAPEEGSIAYILHKVGLDVGSLFNVGEFNYANTQLDHDEVHKLIKSVSHDQFIQAPGLYRNEFIRLLSYLVASGQSTAQWLLSSSVLQWLEIIRASREVDAIKPGYFLAFRMLCFNTFDFSSGDFGSFEYNEEGQEKKFHLSAYQRENTIALLNELKQLNVLTRLVDITVDPSSTAFEFAQKIIKNNSEFFSDLNNSTNQAVTMESGE